MRHFSGPEVIAASPRASMLERGLQLLDAFQSGEDELSLAQLARYTGLPKPTAHRLLRELVRWGGVEATGTGYRLGAHLFTLGQHAPAQRAVRESAAPFIHDLYEQTHQNVHLAVRHEDRTLFLGKVAGPDSMRVQSRVGQSLPLYCTATGKVFLAFGRPELRRTVLSGRLHRFTPHTIILPALLHADLKRTRDRGYGVIVEEFEPGVTAVAAPIFRPDGHVAAAISVAGRIANGKIDSLGAVLRRTAAAVSDDLESRLSGEF